MLEQGALIDGRYEVESMIGEGGLAQVYKVRHKALGSVHALKLLSWRKKQLAERLLTEGRIQAQLAHPNIVSVIDLVQHEGQFGLLMEYVDNQCLEDFIIENGGLGIDGGLELFAPILSAVAAAHDAGVTHRDLKPANVLLAGGPGGVVPKVTDFGIAKVMAELTGTSTAAGATMGTPGYLAPEQIEDSSRIDKRADIFALGAILYELITGRQAFIEDDGTIGVMSTSRVVPPPLTTWLQDVPPHLDAVLARAMAKDPTERYADCVAFAEALYVERPRLKGIVSSTGGSTTTLSLGGAREELERSLERSTMSTTGSGGGSQAPTLVAPLPEASASSNGRVWLGVGLLVAGAILITVALAGSGAFGLQRTLVQNDPVQPTPRQPLLPSDPVEPSVPAPTALAPVGEPPPEPAPAPTPSVPDPAPGVQPSEAPVPAPVETVPPPVEPSPQPIEPEPIAPPEPVDASEPIEGSDTDEPALTAPEPVEPVPVAPEPVVVAPAPPPEPAPVEPAPVPDPPDVAGGWTGKANRRPLRLTLAQDGTALSGRVVFPGATTREEALAGSVDRSGNVRFQAGDLTFTGRLSGGGMAGTYTSGGKALDWSVTRK